MVDFQLMNSTQNGGNGDFLIARFIPHISIDMHTKFDRKISSDLDLGNFPSLNRIHLEPLILLFFKVFKVYFLNYAQEFSHEQNSTIIFIITFAKFSKCKQAVNTSHILIM